MKYLFAFGAFGKNTSEEITKFSLNIKAKLSLNKKNNVHRLKKKASTSSEIVTKVKEKVLSLAQRAFADKIN